MDLLKPTKHIQTEEYLVECVREGKRIPCSNLLLAYSVRASLEATSAIGPFHVVRRIVSTVITEEYVDG